MMHNGELFYLEKLNWKLMEKKLFIEKVITTILKKV